MFFKKFLGLACSAAVFAAAQFQAPDAQAATVVSGVIYEGGVALAPGTPRPDRVLGDFDATIGDPLLLVAGDVEIYGGVAHRTTTLYRDAWTMDFGNTVFDGSFNWQNVRRNPFDGELRVGGVTHVLGDHGSIALSGLTGVVTFVVDPIAGIYGPSPDEVARWDLQLSAVPLPAGAWLLLAGLGGLGALRLGTRRG